MASKIVSDMGTHYYVLRKNHRGDEKRVRVQRYFCIGGPHDRAFRSTDELNEEFGWGKIPYSSFNNSGGSGPKMIFVHVDHLKMRTEK